MSALLVGGLVLNLALVALSVRDGLRYWALMASHIDEKANG